MSRTSRTSRERIASIILEAAADISSRLDAPLPLDQGEQLPLFGPRAALDSLSLATLVIAVEQAMNEEFGATVTLASDEAMSRSRSVFRTVGTLADFASELLAEEAAHG